MQSLDARGQYRNSFHCGYRIFTEEGLLRFWTGATPRLARLVVRRIIRRPFAVAELTIFTRTVEWWYRLHGVREHHQDTEPHPSVMCSHVSVYAYNLVLTLTDCGVACTRGSGSTRQ